MPESTSNTVLLTKEKIEEFMGFINNRQQGTVEAALESNPALQDYFAGKQVNFGTAESPNMKKITPEEWSRYFERAVSAKLPAVANALWNNRLIQGYFCGKAVNFGTTENPKMQMLTLEKQLSWLCNALASCNLLIARQMFQQNDLIQDYLAGELVCFGTTQSKISPTEWLKCFNAAKTYENHMILENMYGFINAMIEINMLKSISQEDSHLNSEANIQLRNVINNRIKFLNQLSASKNISEDKIDFTARKLSNVKIINFIETRRCLKRPLLLWSEEDVSVQFYFCGEKVSLNGEKAEITSKKWLSFFQQALQFFARVDKRDGSSCGCYVIQTMYGCIKTMTNIALLSGLLAMLSDETSNPAEKRLKDIIQKRKDFLTQPVSSASTALITEESVSNQGDSVLYGDRVDFHDFPPVSSVQQPFDNSRTSSLTPSSNAAGKMQTLESKNTAVTPMITEDNVSELKNLLSDLRGNFKKNC